MSASKGRLRSARGRLYRAALRAVSLARAGVELRGTRRAGRTYCFGRLIVPHRAGISLGPRTAFFSGPVPTALRCEPGAEIVIGGGTILNYGVEVVARRRVELGANCMIASYVHIRDTDGRRTAPVAIGDRVWIAHGAVIEPGTVIGDGAVVATMSVVSGIVPPASLAVGNPAVSVPLAGAPPAALEERPDACDGAGPEPPPAPLDDGRGSELAQAVRAAVLDWLDDTRLFGEASQVVTSDALSLREAGVLDSLGLVQLVVMLERRFGVKIDRARAARPDGQSVAALVTLVAAARAHAFASRGQDGAP
ncbi:MAG: hypothetical protein JOZ69_02505 [Myxococcales bacterium]|nr:hypothetical protein [Myxococcales bacterium]